MPRHRDAHLNPLTTTPSVCAYRPRRVVHSGLWCVVYGLLSGTTRRHADMQLLSVITITTILESDIIYFIVQIHREYSFLALNLGKIWNSSAKYLGSKTHCGPNQIIGGLWPSAPPLSRPMFLFEAAEVKRVRWQVHLALAEVCVLSSHCSLVTNIMFVA